MTPISAYLARWGNVSADEGGLWVRTARGCFDAWLAADPEAVPIVVNHGFDFASRDLRPDELGEPAGHWERFEVDEIGLLAHGQLGDSPLGVETAAEIRAGRLTGSSFHGRIHATAPTDETRAGAEVLDMVAVEVVEGGPCPDPADPGAVIVSLGGEHLRDAVPAGLEPLTIADVLAYLESVSGEHITFEDVDRRQSRIREAASEDVDTIERLASRLARIRRSAQTAWLNTRAPWQHPDDTRQYIELDRQAAELEEVLRDALCNDEKLLAQLYVRYDILPAVSPMQRLASLARTSRRGKSAAV